MYRIFDYESNIANYIEGNIFLDQNSVFSILFIIYA